MLFNEIDVIIHYIWDNLCLEFYRLLSRTEPSEECDQLPLSKL